MDISSPSNLASYETKICESSDILENIRREFELYKQENDARLEHIQSQKSVDPLTLEKIERIHTSLDERHTHLLAKSNIRQRPFLPITSEERGDYSDHMEHKSAFRSYMQTGEAPYLKDLEQKNMWRGSGPDGGYLVPIPAETEIMERIANISPIRSIASVRSISSASFRKAFSLTGPASGWVAETDPRLQTQNPQIMDMNFPAMELYAMPAATQSLLDDAAVDIEQWLSSEIFTVFAEQESHAFILGDGQNKPKGFLTYPKVPEAQWSWGSSGYLTTGVAGGFSGTNPCDIFFDLIFSLRAGYRQNAKFVMNRKTQSLIRKFKTTTGEYLWEPPSSVEGSATFLNFPIVEAESMPDIATDSYSIAFGDFQRGYLIVDRIGIRVLRDPYSAKPYVLFYTTKRVGGGMQDFEAIKLLKFGTT